MRNLLLDYVNQTSSAGGLQKKKLGVVKGKRKGKQQQQQIFRRAVVAVVAVRGGFLSTHKDTRARVTVAKAVVR